MSSTSFKDLTGKTFGEWIVLEYLGHSLWLCQCSCEAKTLRKIKGSHLISGKTKSCGCKSNRFIDITGQVFGDLTVLEYLGDRKWKCKCSCEDSKIVIASGYDLRTGRTKSCGHSTTGFKDLTGKNFGNWDVISYAGDGLWNCRCRCSNHTEKQVPRYKLLRGESKSCGCMSNQLRASTMLNKYGDVSSTRISNPRTVEQIQMVKNKESLINTIRTNFKEKPTLFELSKLLDMSVANTSLILHNFGIIDAVRFESYSSHYETEIIRYIKEVKPGIEVVTHNRSILNGNELDIYLPEYKLAIEFNGTYWHSSIQKPINYHQNKTALCAQKHIRLIHIFEHEWNDDRQNKIIKNMLRMKLDPSKNRVIPANKCKIQNVSVEDSKEFVNKYHLQGYSNSSIRYGIYFNDKLLGILTFGKPRFNKEFDYELIRIAWKFDVVVIGGIERLFHKFIVDYNPESIISYCDISKFIGEVYYKLGFKTSSKEKTRPNYVWVNTSSNEVLTRYQTMKQSLIDKGLGKFGDTEDEIMLALGYFKIYDCGNLRFYWTKSN